jgi:thioredoxin-like negative regulator of GroEL
LALETAKVDEADSLVVEAASLYPDASIVGLQTRIRLEKFGAEKALAALPPTDDDIETLCARGSLLLVLSRMDEAAIVLEAAYRRKPDDVDAVRLLALLCVMRNDASRALALAEESMRLAPDRQKDPCCHLLPSRAILASNTEPSLRDAGSRSVGLRPARRRK